MAGIYQTLKREIDFQVRAAMDKCQEYVKQDHEMEVASYYERESPKNKKYRRTATLPNAAHTTPVRKNGNNFEFETEMDENRIDYPVKGMGVDEIIFATNYNLCNTHGRGGYEERLEEDIEKDLTNAFLQSGWFS